MMSKNQKKFRLPKAWQKLKKKTTSFPGLFLGTRLGRNESKDLPHHSDARTTALRESGKS